MLFTQGHFSKTAFIELTCFRCFFDECVNSWRGCRFLLFPSGRKK